MNSFGMPHLMASVVEWMMSDVGGIQSDGAGFKRISVKPYPGEGLNWADASYRSINGKIAVKWNKLKDSAVTMQVVIPTNTEATISVPKNGMKAVVVYEGGVRVWSKKIFLGKVAGLSDAKEDSDYVSFIAGSGSYDFKMERDDSN